MGVRLKGLRDEDGSSVEVNTKDFGSGGGSSGGGSSKVTVVDFAFTHQTPGVLDPTKGAIWHVPSPGQWYTTMSVSITEGFDGADGASAPLAKWFLVQQGATLPDSQLTNAGASDPDGNVGNSTVKVTSGWDSSVRHLVDSIPLVIVVLDWDGNPLVNPTKGAGRVFGIIFE